MNKSTKYILIAGLKRSGTTILWETLRQDKASHCLDEPFHPDLWAGRRSNGKKTWAELGAKWDEQDYATRSELAPILPLDELSANNTDAQRRYLADLSALSHQSVIDEVRIWNRLPDLLPAGPQPLVIHLLRRPDNWTTGHMLPLKDKRSRLADHLRSATFFHRKRSFNNWGYEDIFDAAIGQDHPMWAGLQLPVDELAKQPAFVKLLAFWWASNQVLHRRLANWPGGTVLTLTLAEFVQDPARVISRIYTAAGWKAPEADFNFGHVRQVRPSWKAGSRHWNTAFAKLGIPAEFLDDVSMPGGRAAELLDNNN